MSICILHFLEVKWQLCPHKGGTLEDCLKIDTIKWKAYRVWLSGKGMFLWDILQVSLSNFLVTLLQLCKSTWVFHHAELIDFTLRSAQLIQRTLMFYHFSPFPSSQKSLAGNMEDYYCVDTTQLRRCLMFIINTLKLRIPRSILTGWTQASQKRKWVWKVVVPL